MLLLSAGATRELLLPLVCMCSGWEGFCIPAGLHSSLTRFLPSSPPTPMSMMRSAASYTRVWQPLCESRQGPVFDSWLCPQTPASLEQPRACSFYFLACPSARHQRQGPAQKRRSNRDGNAAIGQRACSKAFDASCGFTWKWR